MEGVKPGVGGAVGAGGAAAEGVLASFFNSLLSKKGVQGSPGVGGAVGSPGGPVGLAGGSPVAGGLAGTSPKAQGNEDCKSSCHIDCFDKNLSYEIKPLTFKHVPVLLFQTRRRRWFGLTLRLS
jgi:hypothetical protein